MVCYSEVQDASGVAHHAQIKVYDPATSAELRAWLSPEDLATKLDAAWVDKHLERIAWCDDGRFQLKQPVPAS